MITSLETFTAYALWIAIIFTVGMNLKDKSWKELFKIAGFLGIGFFCFAGWKLEAATAVHNFSGWIFTALGETMLAKWAATITASILVIAFAGVIWWFLIKLAFKGTSGINKWLLWILTLLGAFTALILFVLPDFGGVANVNYLYAYGLILVFHLAIMLVMYWQAKFQNTLAVPISFTIMLVLINFTHRLYYGQSVVDQYKMSIDFWISFMIMMTVIGVITYVFYKKVEWSKRWSRYIVQTAMLILFVFAGMFMVIQFKGGYHAEQAKIKTAKNAIEFALLTSKIKDVQKTTHNGLTLGQIQNIALNPDGKTTEELERAYKALIEKDKEASDKMEDYTGSETVLDKSWKEKLGIIWPGNWNAGDAEANVPKTWKTVYGPVKFTGKGLEDKNWIKAVEFGKNYRKGDKLIIKGDYFEAYRDGGWQKCKGHSENINKTDNSGVFFGVKTHKGKSFTVEVKRYL